MIHRINVFLLSIFIIFSQTFIISTASASSTSVSGWDVTSSVINGATTTFNATKTKIINGASVAVSGVAKITPTGPQVGKFILKTGLTLAVTVALDELVDGVDYVLDPANNSITYKDKDTSQSPASSQYTATYNNKIYYGSTIDQVCNSVLDAWISNNPIDPNNSQKSSYGRYLFSSRCKVQAYPLNVEVFSIYIEPNPLYDPAAQDERKSIPVDVVGGRIVQDAAQDQAPARDYTGQVANTALADDPADQVVSPAELVSQFENTATYPSDTTAETKSETKSEDGTTEDSKTDLPAACAWMPSVCEAAQVIITKPQVWVDAVKQWVATENPPQTDTKVDIEEPDTTQMPNTSYFGWSAYCPFSKKSDSLSINNQTSSLDSDLTSWCEMATEARPFVIAAGALASLMIVSGISMRGDD